MRLLIAVGVGLLLAGSAPGQEKKAPPPEEREYARVELKGRLDVKGLPGSRGPVLSVRGELYALDLSQQKELKTEDLRKLDGMTIVVSGTLRLPLNSTEMITVLVSGIQVILDQ
jgi:hypothetical protein